MIRTTDLQKRYGRSRALDGLDLSVPAGAIYGLIGQNGAGKTTTIRVLATLMLPDGGRAEVAGADVVREPGEVRQRMGYVPDFFGVYDDLKVGEYLEFYASLYGVRGAAAARLRDDLLDLVDLGYKREAYVEHLSRGMQQRLCLARALVHDPQVLLLDEPASGLDPVARVEMRELLKELRRMGKTILISSHILAELADLCTHVGMMAAGKLVRQGTVDELLWGVSRPGYVLRVLRDQERAAAVLEQTAGVSRVDAAEHGIALECDDAAAAAGALAAVVAAGIPVVHFAEVPNDLETVFLQLSADGAGSAPASAGAAGANGAPKTKEGVAA